MKRALLLIALLAALCPAARAQEGRTHKIDKFLDNCIDKDSSTTGMTECTDKAYKMWDQELNRVYAELMKKLAPEGKAALKQAQLEWLKFRDAEFKLIDSIYDKLEGTMYIPMRAAERMDIVKARAVDLEGYLDLLKD